MSISQKNTIELRMVGVTLVVSYQLEDGNLSGENSIKGAPSALSNAHQASYIILTVYQYSWYTAK